MRGDGEKVAKTLDFHVSMSCAGEATEEDGGK